MLLASGAIGAGQDIQSRGKGLRGQILWQLAQMVLDPSASPIPWPGTAPTPPLTPLAGMKGQNAKGVGWDTQVTLASTSQACPRHGLCSEHC